MSVSQTAVHGPSESEVNSLRVGNASVQERQARQPPTVVRCISLSLGVMTAKDAFCTKWTVSEKVTFVIEYGFRRITLHFGYRGDDYKLVFKFGALQGRRLLVHSASDNEGFFTMPLKEPAEFWVVTYRAQHQAAMGWTRITSLPVTESRMLAPFTEITWRRKAHMQISGEPDAIQIGSWTVYQVKLDLRRVRKRYQEVIRRAALYKLTPKPGKGSSTHAQQQQYIRSTTTSPSIFDRQKREEAITDFDQLYALESAISRRILCEDNLSQAFINLYRSLEPSAACEAIKLMGRERVWEPEAQLKKMASARGRLELKPRKRPPYVVFIRRILVTPTTMELELPQAESTNRITRHYKQHLDRFLRVQFVDEGGRPIHTSTLPKHHVHPIYNRIACVLQNGIQIGSRQYDFLAFSSSQLRAHSCWFFASTEDLNAEMIRSWMGDFSYERIVAKYAARMGQCFSTTHPIIKLEKQEVTMIHDIVRDKYTFSDGVGLVSRNMANTVARKMGIKGRTPSAYQIRLGGAKGVLTVSHQDLPDKASIALRPSQIKFQSNHRTLEVIQFAKYSPLRLNCQIILLLSTLGVSDEVFLDLLEKTIAMYEPITTNPTKASQILRRHIDDYGINASMARIVEAGFLVRKDPYIINLLNMFRISKLKEVKKRAKLDVFNKGAHLLGVLDETDSLEENQIFCQLSDAHRFHGSTSARQIIKGKCIVYRSPSLHPGDIRTVEAVDCPALHHLENVVVFSAKGSRSLPNMCSGGDLDGDQYSIIWDPKLFPSCKLENQKPMDFDTPIAARVSQVCVRHLQSFFVKAIINDNLGIIANAHMARADASDKNAFDGDCLELARRHSIAVDFPKTGIPASMPARLRVSKYPDFMEKKDKVTYESGKILGQLYRAIDKGVYRGYREQLENPTQFDPLLWTEGMVQHIAAARRLKRLYEREIQGLMANFGIPTEAELLSGSIIQWMQKERHQKYFEVRDEARKAVVRLRESWYKKEFPQNKNNKELEAKAAAWYYVTYHPTEQRSRKRRGHNHQRRKDIKYISFPWVAQDILCRIMRKNWKREILPQHSQAFSEEEIRKYKSTGLQDEEDDSSDTDDLDDMLYTASSSSSDEE